MTPKLTPEFLERVRLDYKLEPIQTDWDSYLAGYWAAVKRFGLQRELRREGRESRRETKSKLGYSRIGRNNV